MEMEFNHGKILPTVMENELQNSFIDYAMSVSPVGRCLMCVMV